MCYPPFKTGMERILVIRQLRDAGRFPEDFDQHEAGRVMKPIILKLVAKSPYMRISAKDLLSSPLLPPKTDTDSKYLYEITTAISKSNANIDKVQIILDSIYKQTLYKNMATTNTHSSSLLSFNSRSSAAAAATNITSTDEIFFDMKSLNRAYLNIQPKVLRVLTSRSGTSPTAAVTSGSSNVNATTSTSGINLIRNMSATGGASKPVTTPKYGASAAEHASNSTSAAPACVLTTVQLTASISSRVEEIFKSHGAIHFSPTLLLPISKLSQVYSREALHQYTKYMDMNGNIFALPNNLITGYTRYAALLHIENSRRYEVSSSVSPSITYYLCCFTYRTHTYGFYEYVLL